MSDSGDSKQDRQRELEAEREFYTDTPDEVEQLLEDFAEIAQRKGASPEGIWRAKVEFDRLLLEARIEAATHCKEVQPVTDGAKFERRNNRIDTYLTQLEAELKAQLAKMK